MKKGVSIERLELLRGFVKDWTSQKGGRYFSKVSRARNKSFGDLEQVDALRMKQISTCERGQDIFFGLGGCFYGFTIQ